MPNSLLDEVTGIVGLVVEPDHAGDLELLEYGHVVGGS